MSMGSLLAARTIVRASTLVALVENDTGSQ
jgi:hypothetical protein